MKRLLILVCLFSVSVVRADEKKANDERAEAAKAKIQVPALPPNATSQVKRQWLLDNIIKRQQDPALVRRYTQQMAGMSDRQIDGLIHHYQSQLAQKSPQRGTRQMTPSQRAAAVEAYRRKMALARNRNVGFRPVITWLPSGTSLNAGAVVSPDGRHVRMSLNPFFSNVPYFDTFNMSNGQTRRHYLNQPTPMGGFRPGFGPRQPTTSRRPSVPTRPIPSWYRRIRTR